MPSRFSSNYDYSQTFQYLVEQNQSSLEAAARSLDADREAEWAARDALVFTKWQEGKLSGNELMAHINQRMRQTSYDKTQQLKWKEAAVEYGNVIADEKAEAAYAQSDNINALIAHYSKRLAQTKAGTPARRELAERLKSLREKRDTDRIRTQARRIQRQIDRGQMSTKDMIDFYKSQLGQVSDPELRADIKDNIAKLQGKLREERFEVAMTDIDTKLEAGHMSPQAAADAKARVLSRFGIENQDPVAFSQWQQQLQQLRATPDPAVVAQLETQLAAGTISPEEYASAIRGFAEAIAPYDLNASWELKQEAQNFINEYATPLAEGSLLGQASASGQRSDGTYSGTVEVVRKLRGNAIKHITQFDGGRYNSTNCGMAAGAMVAHMMGYTGLTGSDLRALSGDTEGGTNVWQAMGAMTNKQVGIPADQLDARSNWSFEEFKQRVANGAPAVLSGWTGDLPPQLNSTSGIMGHGVAIAGYDAKRDAFLVLDPSGRGDQAKAWWPAEVVKAFAWGGQGGFNGIAMLGPTGTIDPKTLQRTGGKIRHIEVTAPPERFPDAPRIESPMDPGPARRAQAANDALTKLQKKRLQDAGIIPGKDLDTKQEVSQLLAERDETIADLRGIVDEWVELSQNPGAYDEETGTVQLVSNGQRLTGEEIAQMQKHLLFLYDGQQILYRANDEPGKAAEMQSEKNAVVVDAAVVNTLEAEYATNRVQREMRTRISDMKAARTPQERRRLAASVMEDIGSIAAIYDAEDEGDTGAATEDKTDVERQTELVDTLTLPNEWGALADAIENIGDAESAQQAAQELVEVITGLEIYGDNEELLNDVMQTVIDEKAIETGEAKYVMADGQLWVATYDVVERVDPVTGETFEEEVLDVTNLPDHVKDQMEQQGITPDDITTVALPGEKGGEPIDAVPQRVQYQNLHFLTGTNSGPARSVLEEWEIPADVIQAIEDGVPLNNDQIGTLGKTNIDRLVRAGSLTRIPFTAQRLQYQGDTYWLDEGVAGATPTWHKGKLPFTPSSLDDPNDPILNRGGAVGVSAAASGAWPDIDPDETDTDTGRLVPNFGVADKDYDKVAREVQEKSDYPSIIKVRNPLDPEQLMDRPADNVFVTGLIQPLYKAVETAKAKLAARDDAIVSTLPEAEAADVAFWSEQEKQDYAASLGWDPETEQFSIDQPTTDEPTRQSMESLGIKSKQPEAETVQTYDPTKVAREQALGVAKANKAERDAKRKAALAERDQAAKAAIRTPLPKLTPKIPTVSDKSDYGPRIDKSAGYSPPSSSDSGIGYPMGMKPDIKPKNPLATTPDADRSGYGY